MYQHYDIDSVIICGDFNSRIGKTQDGNEGTDELPPRITIDNTQNQHGNSFLEFLNDSRCCVLNGRYGNESNEYTYYSTRGKSVVDYICVPHDIFKQCKNFRITNCKDLIEEFNLFRLLGEKSKSPDHALLSFELAINAEIPHLTADKCLTPNAAKNHRYKLRQIPPDFMKSNIATSAISRLITNIEQSRSTQNQSDDLYNDLCNIIIKEMEDVIPKFDCTARTRKKFKYHKPFWNEELTSLWKIARENEKKFLKCKQNHREKQELQKKFKYSQNKLDRRLRYYDRKWRKGESLEIEEISVKDPRKFWDKIKHLGPKRKSKIPYECYMEDGSVTTNPEYLKQKWKSEFSNLYNPNTDSSFDSEFRNTAIIQKHAFEQNMLDPLYISNSELNKTIDINEIRNIVLKNKDGKSTGIDQLPNEVLKNDTVIKALHKMFNFIFENHKIPTIWKKAIIYPILKDPNSDHRIPLNYRGISLLSVISKAYSSVLNNRLTAYLEDNELLVDEQNGFRKDRNCEDHVFTLNSLIQNRDTTFVTFIDLQKAFDTVDRDLLQYSLLTNGVDGHFYNNVKSLYHNTESCVRIGDHHTAWFNCTSGVRQGDNLSPTLFALFINDLAREVKNTKKGIPIHHTDVGILLYADDIALITENERNMQDTLDVVSNWCKKWHLQINLAKTKILHFRKRNSKKSNFTFYIGNTKLEYASVYKYLGVLFNENRDFKNNAENLSKSGGRALGSLISKIHSLKDIGFTTFEKLFYSCVAPVIDYCSGVWGYQNFHSLDQVQDRAARYFLGTHRLAPLLAVRGETGWAPASSRHKSNMVRLWNKFQTMDNNRTAKQVFIWDQCLNNERGWNCQLKAVLNSVNMSNIYTNAICCDVQLFIQNQHSTSENIWFANLQNSPKLRTYRLLKQNFSTENYLLMNIPKNQRSALAQLRCGILPLRVETGRFRNEPLTDRLCVFCNLNEIENEIHFILKCTLYNDLRNLLIRNTTGSTNYEEFELFRTLVCTYPRQCSQFIINALKLRQSKFSR